MPELYPSINYKPKAAFWTSQQLRGFERSYNKRRFALFHEPRCGKSKIIVDTCCICYQNKQFIRGLVVVVYPNGGHVGWVRDAFPENATVPWRGFIWDSPAWEKRSTKHNWIRFMEYADGFRVLAVNAEALILDKCIKAIEQFITSCGKVMLAADESSFMADHTAKRSKRMHKLTTNPGVAMLRILDGTPVGRYGPLDLYSQVGFLGWDILGHQNHTAFKNHYCEVETRGRTLFWATVNAVLKDDPELAKEAAANLAKRRTVTEGGVPRRLKRGRDFWTVLKEDEQGKPKFKNMDELWKRMEPVSDRATFPECFPNAKKPIFTQRYFILSPEQRRVYDQLSSQYLAELGDGTVITKAHHLARTLTLQQVASNYYPNQKVLSLHEACEGLGCDLCSDGIIETETPLKVIDPDNNPRMEALAEELKEGRPTIIWCRFIQDAQAAYEVAEKAGMNPVRHDGTVNNAQKLWAREQFQDKKLSGAFVANWASGSRAIRLDAAQKHVCVSNGWSYRTRKQGEDRSEHGSKSFATSFIDLVGVDTVDDTAIMPALRQGLDVSTYVLRDPRRAWI